MYKHPGVYIEHVPSGVLAIEAVSTAVAAFIGPVKRGVAGAPVFISSATQFAQLFGELGDTAGGVRDLGSAPDYFGLAVNAYFGNGGSKAYIVPVQATGGGKAIAAIVDPNDAAKAFYFSATSNGLWANGLEIVLQAVDPAHLELGYTLTLQVAVPGEKKPKVLERFADVTLDPDDGRYFATRLNAQSDLVDAERKDIAGAAGGGRTTALLSAALSAEDVAAVPAGATLAVSIDGAAAVTATLAAAPATLDALAAGLQAAIRTAGGADFLVQATRDRKLLLISGGTGANPSVVATGGTARHLLRLDPTLIVGAVAPAANLGAAIDTLTLDLTGNTKDFSVAFVAADDTLAKVATKIVTEGKKTANAGANFKAEALGDRLFMWMDGQDATKEVKVRGGTAVGALGLAGPAAGRPEALAYPAIVTGGKGTANLMGGADAGPPNNAAYDAVFEKLRDYRDITILLLPGRVWGNGQGKDELDDAVTHAEFMQNRMVIVDPPGPNTTRLTTPADVATLGAPTSPYAVLYYPWIEVTNPFYHPETAANKAKTFQVPASAFAAGMWARIDAQRGVWKAPAGLEATVRGLQGPTLLIGNDLQDNLNDQGVNCLRAIIGPTVIWGARTLATRSKPEFRYVPVRRTQNMIGESLYQALQAVVFEPNDHRLWASLRASATDFMDGLFRSGAFQGEKASDAYFVRCGLGPTMTQGDIDAGIVRLVVGFAPLKPAEFVVVQIQQIVGRQA